MPTPNREKIWAGGYVDLEVLLKRSRDLRGDPTSSGELVMTNGHLVVEKQQSKPINTIQTRASAFIVFLSVYLEKFSGKSQELTKYMHDIRFALQAQPDFPCLHSQWRTALPVQCLSQKLPPER